MSSPIHVTDAEFETTVLKSETPVLVDFWAAWCAPCRMLTRPLEEIASETDGRLTIAKVDVDEHQESARKLGVANLPTLILFKNGEEVERIHGFKQKRKLLEIMAPHVDGLSDS